MNVVADTIFKQLGGNRFVAMTGAKEFLCDDNTMTFTIPRARKIRRVVIEWKPGEDLYHMQFWSAYGLASKLVTERLYVYGEDLQQNFTDVTGLETHL